MLLRNLYRDCNNGLPVNVCWEGIIPQSMNLAEYSGFEALMNQMAMGLDQEAFCGRLSFKWKLATIAYNKERGLAHSIQAEQWSEHIIAGLWHMGVDSWIIRNMELYGYSEEEQLTKMTTEVDDQIQQ